MPLKNKRILITGGLGLVGSQLAHSLVLQGAKVIILDCLNPEYGANLFNVESIKNEIEIIIGDIRDKIVIDSLLIKVDIVFHLAAQTSHVGSMKDPYSDYEINSLATVNILETIRHRNPNARFVFASTRQIYGKPQYLPVDEEHPIQPVDVNGINKYSSELLINLYHKIYKIKTTILRLTNTYGPGMRIKDAKQTFLGIWIKHLLQGKPINVYGDGNQLRDFNYVEDVVLALLKVVISNLAIGKTYNIGCEKSHRLIDIADMMCSLESNSTYLLQEFPKDRKMIDIGDFYSDISLIKNDLNWVPNMDINNGLIKTINYYEKNLEHYL